MNKEKFYNLCKEDQEIVLEEMCRLYSLIYDYPVIYEDLKICAKWISQTCFHGKHLEEKLNSILKNFSR